nr:putative ribonuclease H-like domain-containing protein [Tanacetum cinerariifolium]
MIGSLMYLTASRPDIMFAVCACSRDFPFNLEAYLDSDYAGANLDRKSTTGGCQFLDRRLISWQRKKQTIVATSTTKVEYVVAAHCCGQVLWIQSQMLDYGFNFMNTKIYIDNESIICIVKNPLYHSKTKHMEISHHFIRDSYEKRLIQMSLNVARFSLYYWMKLCAASIIVDVAKLISPDLQTEAHIEQILPSPSTYQGKHRKTHKPMKPVKVTELPQTSMPLDLGACEVVHQEGGDRPKRQETILGGADAQTRFETASKRSSDPLLSTGHTVRSREERMEQETNLTDFVPPTPYDSPISGGYTSGSDEGRPNLFKLMNICTTLLNRVLALEESNTTQDKVITRLKLRVRRLEKKTKARTSQPMKKRLFKGRVETWVRMHPNRGGMMIKHKS